MKKKPVTARRPHEAMVRFDRLLATMAPKAEAPKTVAPKRTLKKSRAPKRQTAK